MKKKILMSLFTIAIVGTLIGGAVATFTATDTSNPNIFTTGTVIVTLDSQGSSWTGNFGNMKAGETVYFNIALTSSGTLPVNYQIVTAIGGSLSGGATPAKVTGVWCDRNADGSPTPGSSGKLSAAGMGDAVDLIVVAVKLPSNADNTYQGLNGTLTVTVNATQQ